MRPIKLSRWAISGFYEQIEAMASKRRKSRTRGELRKEDEDLPTKGDAQREVPLRLN
ncbi:MAG: hypothetical protein WBG92_08395 [Thiohalocapsa sp.]